MIAEDDRNLARLVKPAARSGLGLDALWADDLHHHLRRLLAGDAEGYFADYSGTTRDLAATIRQGWFYVGQKSAHRRAPRGTSPAGVSPSRCVVCLQNHDQVGNRAHGERLHHQIDHAAFRAASLLLLTLPQTPLLFMGQEWAASTPFQYFTDHAEPLGGMVTAGRRREFAAFAEFANPLSRQRIPDPQAVRTFHDSRLRWRERTDEPHASMLRLYTAVLAFRATGLAPPRGAGAVACALGDDTIGVQRKGAGGEQVVIVARLRGRGTVDLGKSTLTAGVSQWTTIMTSEDAAFSPSPAAPAVDCRGSAPVIRFTGPAAVVLRSAIAHVLPFTGPGAGSRAKRPGSRLASALRRETVEHPA